MSRLIFFMHIPKTAGTSFRVMLSDVFEENHILPNKEDIRNNNGLYPGLPDLQNYLKSRPSSEVKLLIGHYPFLTPERVFGNAIETSTISFVREPIQRTISHLLQLQNHHKNYKGKSLEEILVQAEDILFNIQTRMFCGASKKRHEILLHRAIENMKTCSFVGLTEQFDRSVFKIEKALKLKFDRKLHLNRRSLKSKPRIAPAIVERINQITKMDQELYEIAKSLFFKDYEL